MIKDVFLAGEKVGTIEITQKGLYYRFCCKCRFREHGKYRIMANCGGKCVSLGICVPNGHDFGFVTSLPVKRFGSGDMIFTAVVPDEERFYTIISQQPVACIGQLRKAKFAVRDGQAGLIITEKSSDQ